MFYDSFWSVLPSIIAIAMALIIKEPHVSLFIGAIIGACFVAGFHPVKTIEVFVSDGILQAIADNAGIIAFVVLLGIIIRIINKTGGAESFGRWASKHIKTQTGAVLATFFLGVLIFIDDMFNCFTVGAVMMPVTERCKVSRQKLAWLLDATAAPICMIAPISSWGAAVSSTAEGLGTGISGIDLFIKAIPYNFYSLLTLVFIVTIGIMNFDYGKMRSYQKAAESRKEEICDRPELKNEEGSHGRIADLVIPVAVMIVVCTLSMMYVGGFFDRTSPAFHDFAASFGCTDGAKALSMGGLVTLIFTVIFSLIRKTISFSRLTECVGESFKIMGSPLVILILAVSLKNMTTILGVRNYLSFVMSTAADSLYSLLPAVIFIVACIAAFASGTSWGTFGILIPIVTAVFPSDSRLVVIGISACLAGAVCGDHCSPISDTTIMSSAAAQCDHLTHVTTQLPYAITVAIISFIIYIIAGYIQNPAICLITGTVMVVLVLLVIRKVQTVLQKE